MALSPKAGKPVWRGVQPLAEIVPDLLDPVLQKRAGLSTALVSAWPEIAGERLANGSVPQKIVWSRAATSADAQAPATLVVSADPSVALALQHETGALAARVNAFFGYPAVDRIRIVQKVLGRAPKRARPPAPDAAQRRQAEALVRGVEDDALRESLARLGASVIARRARGG